jgi:5'-3' exonuclease
MSAPDGRPVAAAYGFAGTLARYLAEAQPSHAAVCFDYALECFRHALDPGYKASRGVPPPELEAQFELCAEVAQAFGVAVYSAPDYEADDVIATLAERVLAAGADVVVVSSDKDLAQLVREDGRVVLHDFARGRTLDAAAVREQFGVAPGQIPDLLGLAGDAVDDLPGVPGVGRRGAAAALRAFGSLDAMPERVDAWDGLPLRGARRLAERIAVHRAEALRCRRLATLVRDVPGLAVALEDLAWAGADRALAGPLFERLGWRGLAARVPRWADSPRTAS